MSRSGFRHRIRKGALGIGPLVLAVLMLTALPSRAAKFAGAFMDDGGGARALALGGAFTAVASDPSACYWNPAGLSGIGSRQVLLMHSERFGDLIDRDFVAYVQPVDWSLLGGTESGFGISVIRLGLDDIPFTDHLFDQLDHNDDGVVSDDEILGIDDFPGPSMFDLQDQIRYKSDSELALFVSYAERKGDWRMGGSLKLIRQSIGDYNSLGIGFDFALLRPRIWKAMDFGVKFQDITTTYLSWNTEDGTNETIYPVITPGLAYHVPVPSWDASVMFASSLETHFDDRRGADQYWGGGFSANLRLGAEVGFKERVFLRGGFDSGFENENLTAGVGFRLDRLMVDYAYAGDILDTDDETHRVSITALF